MEFKSYKKRLEETHDLELLCRNAGYLSHYTIPVTKPTQDAVKDLKERYPYARVSKKLLKINVGILCSTERYTKDKMWATRLFLRELPPEGVEIFYFEDKFKWFQEEQTSEGGLIYFCLPDLTRMKCEEERLRMLTPDIEERMASAFESYFKLKQGFVKIDRLKNKSKEGVPAWLAIDSMFPDKWSHMALEILLRQAEANLQKRRVLTPQSSYY